MRGRGVLPERRDGRAQPGVEPLSLKAWERVETRLFERIERGELTPRASLASRAVPHAPLWVGAAALVAAASVLLWWRWEAAPLEMARATSAAVQVSALPGPAATSPAPDRALAPAAPEVTRIVTTTAATETTIGEAEVTLAAHSDVNFSGSDATGWLVRLERGQVDCHVAPRHGRPPFVVQAGDTRVSVVGTRFSVQREGSAVAVSVREGHVRVAAGSLELMLGPGEQWPAPLRASASINAKKGPRVAPAAQARDRFERAARLEVSAPEQALRLYDSLARGRGPWSANALYAQARLQFERGALAQAKPLLLRYLQRYPKGVNAVDVRKLLLEIDTRHE